ncbi:Major facilitator superfamily domain, general substrate transporter [Penicillium italicum]|uniref:Major facilitator superfamily domain, general substrate transporter n=1 Tax=Penicillium italicum TaxID=40296 RepID=A0A0A2LEK3_PENIT|nr:Major facilitator superfamily domain, general substrate transporter [Penicillium italicum]
MTPKLESREHTPARMKEISLQHIKKRPGPTTNVEAVNQNAESTVTTQPNIMADIKTPVSDSHDISPSFSDNAINHAHIIDMEHYNATVPLWKRVWQHSLTQMILLSIQAFCGPAMADAITGLGGGGLASPRVSNICTAITYALLAVVCFFGGPLVNKIGIKWALVIGSLSFPIEGSAYYCNSKFGNQWYLILSGAISGVGTACWYVAEAGAIMTLAPSGARGKYLALWIVSRNLGQLVGGAINLSKNYEKGVSGGVTPKTYVAFVIIECLAGTWTTYLGTHFTVRARALSSLISPFFCKIGCFGLGFILDMKGLSQRRRAQIGLFTVVILNVGVYIWSIIMQAKFSRNNPGAIDWDDRLYASSFLPYLFVQTTGLLSQSYMYWLLSSFANDAQDMPENVRNGATFRSIEANGQAIAYGMNTQTTNDPMVGFCVTFGLLGAALIPMIMLVNTTPDRIPADLIAEEQIAADEKIRDVQVRP